MLSLDSKLKLIRAVAKAVDDGYEICKAIFFSERSKICCPIGALTHENNPTVDNSIDRNRIVEAASILGCSSSDVWAIVNGFDGTPRIEGDAACYKFGAALCEIFQPKPLYE